MDRHTTKRDGRGEYPPARCGITLFVLVLIAAALIALSFATGNVRLYMLSVLLWPLPVLLLACARLRRAWSDPPEPGQAGFGANAASGPSTPARTTATLAAPDRWEFPLLSRVFAGISVLAIGYSAVARDLATLVTVGLSAAVTTLLLVIAANVTRWESLRTRLVMRPQPMRIDGCRADSLGESIRLCAVVLFLWGIGFRIAPVFMPGL